MSVRKNETLDQRWVSGTGSKAVDIDRYQYTYDRDGDPLAKVNTLAKGLSEANSRIRPTPRLRTW